MRKGRTIGIAVLGGLVIIAGMFAYANFEQKKTLEKIQISLEYVVFQRINLIPAGLDFAFQIDNPNDITTTFDRADYKIFMNDLLFANGVMDERVDVPAFSSRTIHIVLGVDMTALSPSNADVLMEGQATWRIIGTSYYETAFGTIKVPFDSTFQQGSK